METVADRYPPTPRNPPCQGTPPPPRAPIMAPELIRQAVDARLNDGDDAQPVQDYAAGRHWPATGYRSTNSTLDLDDDLGPG
jgi:hypothetical protein